MANRIADRAVQIFGGHAYMRENVAERFFRDAGSRRLPNPGDFNCFRDVQVVKSNTHE